MILLRDPDPVGTYTSGRQDIIGTVLCDTFYDLPGADDISGFHLIMGSTAEIIDNGERYRLDSSGVWMLQPDPSAYQTTVTLDLTGYYTAAQADDRYQRIGTGSTITNTDCDTLAVGRYRNSGTSHGCTNLPTPLLNRPFQIDVTEMAVAGRKRQTAYGTQQSTIGFMWQRAQYSSGGVNVWSPWYEYAGTAI